MSTLIAHPATRPANAHKPARAPFSATNWSSPEDGFSVTFYDKYRSQLWFPEEIPLTNDALDPHSKMPEFKVCAAALEPNVAADEPHKPAIR